MTKEKQITKNLLIMVINFLIFFKNLFIFLGLILSQLIYVVLHNLNWPREKKSDKVFAIFKNKKVLILGAEKVYQS